jgi:Zn-dependent protease
MQGVLDTVYLAAGLLVALVCHEYAHAVVAVRLGDQTPRQMGRHTLNPKALVDPFGTYVLPAILLLPVLFGRGVLFPIFAYAKPMPLNPWNLRRPDNHSVWIALAGIGANVALAFAFGGLLRGVGFDAGQFSRFLADCLLVNVIMAAMQIVPIPGLDGGRVVARFLPQRPREVYANLEQYLALFILVVFFIFAGPVFLFVHAIGNGICNVTAGVTCFS